MPQHEGWTQNPAMAAAMVVDARVLPPLPLYLLLLLLEAVVEEEEEEEREQVRGSHVVVVVEEEEARPQHRGRGGTWRGTRR